MPNAGMGHGWSGAKAVHKLAKKKIPSNIAGIRQTEHASNKCPYAFAFKEGDIVKVLKKGSSNGGKQQLPTMFTPAGGAGRGNGSGIRGKWCYRCGQGGHDSKSPDCRQPDAVHPDAPEWFKRKNGVGGGRGGGGRVMQHWNALASCYAGKCS